MLDGHVWDCLLTVFAFEYFGSHSHLQNIAALKKSETHLVFFFYVVSTLFL